jgi:hypothetical protein
MRVLKKSSSSPSQPLGTDLKEREKSGILRGHYLLLAALPPFGAMLDNPVRQGALEPDITAGLLGFYPLVLENFLTLGLKFPVK